MTTAENPMIEPAQAVADNNGPIFAALAKARASFPVIPKNRVATIKSDKAQYSYKYADLSDVFEAIDPALSANGLTIMQFPSAADLITTIGHESGKSLVGTWPIKAMKGQDLSNAQAYQAAVQVAKRYALTAMLGVSTEETVEGDMRRKMPTDPMSDAFETGDGVRAPKGAKFTAAMSKRQMAEEAARAIEVQFREAKTGKGLSGAWDRNTMFIDKMAESYGDLYENLSDVFAVCLDAFDAPVTEGNEE
jgi:hypothetical protein